MADQSIIKTSSITDINSNEENQVSKSVVIKNLTEGIFTVRKDIKPYSNSHIAIYGENNEKNNYEAIEKWVRIKLQQKEYNLLSLMCEFNRHYELFEEELHYNIM